MNEENGENDLFVYGVKRRLLWRNEDGRMVEQNEAEDR